MSLLGFDAIGRFALGQLPEKTLVPFILPVTVASYAVTVSAVSFKSTENISPAAFVVAGQGVTIAEKEAVSSASFALTTVPVTIARAIAVAPAAFSITANPTTEPEVGFVAATSLSLTFNDVPLFWAGAGIDTSYSGGVGHYKLDLERARQLAKLERKIPPPLDLRTAPTFKAVGSPPIAPALPAPMMAAAANQPTGEAAAKVQRQRRDLEAILLLAS